MRGRDVFYPMGWDDNGLPTERRVQNYFGVRCDPSLPYDPAFVAAGEARASSRSPVSRPNFIELCEQLTAEDEKAFEDLWQYLGLSVDWRDDLLDHRRRESQRVSQRAFLRLLSARHRLSTRSADALGRGLPHRGGAGRARGPRSAGRVPQACASRKSSGGDDRHRHHAPRAAPRVRRAGRASRTTRGTAAVRHRRR